jgi:hypothetical protein
MSRDRITLLPSQERQLLELFKADPNGHERAAAVLLRRLHRPIDGLPASDRYLAVEVVPFAESWITSSSSTHVAYELRHLRDLFRRCDEERLVFGFVHNHPGGFPTFSETDDRNEETLLNALTNRNGRRIQFAALLWTNGAWKARIRDGSTPAESAEVRHVVVAGRPMKIFNSDVGDVSSEELFARQAAAFGQPFVKQLQSLRVGVVGSGGTGTSTATLLARAGVGELVLFDADRVEGSNLNRLRGATLRDIGKNKAGVLRDFITSLGLSTKVVAFETLVDQDPSAIDALSSCDVIFGCTDDQIGREVLNTAVYVYAQPYVDLGLGGRIDADRDGRPYLRYHHGRVSTILPEDGECLFCQGVIRDAVIRHEYALRANPRMTQDEARDRYLEGGGEQAPGVGPFTSAIADYGVATLFDLVRPFRHFPDELRWDAFSIDFVRMSFRSVQEKSDLDCPYCRKREFLLRREEYRLNRPMLGKADVSN